MTIGERIKCLRSSLGYSQVDFADKIDVSKQTLYKYENNVITNIPSDKIEAIAHICKVSPAYIMGWDDKRADLSNVDTIPIDSDEHELLDKYHQLNNDGKSRLIERADELIDLGYVIKGDALNQA